MSSYLSSKTQVIEDSKKKSSLLKDNSWIRKTDDEDEPVDRDPNFGKTVLGKVKTSETTVSSSEPLPEKTAKPRGSSVQALTQRFSGSTEDLKTMTPSYYSKRNSSGKTEASSTTKTTIVTKGGTTETTATTTQSVKSPVTKSATKTDTFMERVKYSSQGTKTTIVTKGGTTETTATTTQSVKSPVTKSATKTDTFMERIKSSSQGPQYVNYSPTKTTKPTITSTKDADNQLNNSPTPSSVKDDFSTNSRTTVSTTETVSVKDSSDAKAKDKLYDILLPDAITSSVSSTSTIRSETIIVESSKEPQYVNYSPTKTTKPTITSTKDSDNQLNNSPTPSSVKDDFSTNSRTTVSTTETVSVKDSSDAKAKDKLYDILLPDAITSSVSSTSTIRSETIIVESSKEDNTKKTTTTTTNTSSTPVDDLYDSLLPKSITSPVSSSTTVKETIKVSSRKEEESPPTPSSTRSLSYSSYPDDTSYTHSSSYSSEYKTYSYSKADSSYEYSSFKSPSLYTSTSYKSSSLSDDILSDPIYSKSSMKSVYKSPDRPVLEKDLCTSCRKPFTGDAKMVLDDMKIRCHATCFKCDVCNGSLGNLKAGDSMWIYKRMVHCENCFEITRDKWHR